MTRRVAWCDHCQAYGPANHQHETLALDIAAQAQADAIVARHRRMAQSAGSDPSVVDSPFYRAMLTRNVAPDVAAAILAAK